MLRSAGEQAIISEPVVARVPWSEKLFSAAVLQLENGKTSSERELYFFDNHSEATSGEKPSFGLKAAETLESSKKYV